MAATGKDGITHYSWADVYSDLGHIKWPDRRTWATYECEALTRNRQRPCGAIRVTALSYIEHGTTGDIIRGEYTVDVELKRRVYMADEVHRAIQAAKERARAKWEAKYGRYVGTPQ